MRHVQIAITMYTFDLIHLNLLPIPAATLALTRSFSRYILCDLYNLGCLTCFMKKINTITAK